MANKDIILVTGATGKQGGSTLGYLAKHGVRAFLASRAPTLVWEVSVGADAVARETSAAPSRENGLLC